MSSEVRRPVRSGSGGDERPADLHPDYPLPDVDHPVTRPFWDACKQHKLVLQRDRGTGAYHWPPKPAYWKGGRLEWVEASGRGSVYSYVVGREPFLPAFQHMLPHVMVLVELDEGPRLVGYMVGCAVDEMHVGMRLRVAWRDLTGRVSLPVWERDL
jgi:hypothetical protein